MKRLQAVKRQQTFSIFNLYIPAYAKNNRLQAK